MTRLDAPAYLGHLRRESARFADVLAGCAPDARVPSCPDWDAADLLWHLTTVHHFWHHVVTHRPAEPPEDLAPARPTAYDDLLAVHRATAERLHDALAAADAAEAAWTWASGPGSQTVGFVQRRQAHEALIHRLDAELTAGTPTALPADLATDGVDECLDVMYGGLPEWGSFAPEDLFVEYRVSDTGTSLWTRLGTFSGTEPDGTERAGEPDQHVVPDPGRAADVVVTGTADRLDGWLWHRYDATGITVDGDPAVWTRARAVLGQAVD
ncbi:maleylpyruvate isomerase family mycothiol-dependent enzyme [Nocardioides sp. LML1-1-1.1]|uniref:maleylpyruvate isomerase family mycothiol-dependent enzyme n=1 Tax=Nocardioides sp. LML1-1-1.1 TaxID=3135248 RepID=UPI00344893D0